MGGVGRLHRVLPLIVCIALTAGCGNATSSPEPPTPTGSQVALDPGLPLTVTPEATTANPKAGQPNRIEIPALGISVPVVPIGLTRGRLVPPSNPQVIGWWNEGAVPGAAKGTAILTGHTVSTGGGAFNDLRKLRRGDRVTIRTSRGRIRYRIVDVVYYPKADLARLSDRLFSQTVPGRLALATCSAFDGKEYRGNTVAFATPVP